MIKLRFIHPGAKFTVRPTDSQWSLSARSFPSGTELSFSSAHSKRLEYANESDWTDCKGDVDPKQQEPGGSAQILTRSARKIGTPRVNSTLFLIVPNRPRTAWFTPRKPIGKEFGGEFEVNRPRSTRFGRRDRSGRLWRSPRRRRSTGRNETKIEKARFGVSAVAPAPPLRRPERHRDAIENRRDD